MNEVTIIEASNAVAIYSGGLDAVLNDLAKEAKSIVADISTDRGRKEIASVAYKVARSKTLLDDMGKKLGEEAKAKLDAINADRRKARDFCDALKDEVRRPLTEWEEFEKKRVERHESNLREIIGAGDASINEWMNISAPAMRERLAEIEAERTFLKWEEFSARAEKAINEASEKIKQAIANREKYDEEQAELERLRAEDDKRQKLKAEQERVEREERIKAEAADAARKAAEAKAAADAAVAKAAADAALAAQKAAEEKARKDAVEAAERAEQAERERLAAVAKAEADRIESAARAEREKLAAIEAERKRAAEAAKAEADAAAKREQDKKHKAKINNGAVAALMAEGLAEDVAKIAVSAIARGLVPNVRIAY